MSAPVARTRPTSARYVLTVAIEGADAATRTRTLRAALKLLLRVLRVRVVRVQEAPTQ